MGATTSSTQNGILIQTDKAYYYPGQIVTGNAYLNIKQQYPASLLNIKLKGIEYVNIKEQQGEQIKTHDGQNQLYCNQVCLANFDNYMGVPVGQFTYPFSFILTQKLPGNFQYQGPQYKAIVKYKIQVELIPTKQGEGVPPQLKNTQMLTIREIYEHSWNMNDLAAESHIAIRTWCCINRGESHLQSYFDRSYYVQGDYANIIAEIDNHACNIDIKNIQCQLEMNLALRDNFGYEQTFQEDIYQEKYNGVKAHHTALGENQLHITIQLINNQNQKVMQSSCNGELVKCSYNLIMVSDMNGVICCFSSHPTVSIPVVVVAAGVDFGNIQKPSDWRPYENNPVKLNFDQENFYGNRHVVTPQIGSISQTEKIQDMNIPMQNPAQIQQDTKESNPNQNPEKEPATQDLSNPANNIPLKTSAEKQKTRVESREENTRNQNIVKEELYDSQIHAKLQEKQQ